MNKEEENIETEAYITLKEAAKLSGYSADYIGQLIRKGKLPGRQVYTNIAWVTTEQALKDYLDKEKRGKSEVSNDDVPTVPSRSERNIVIEGASKVFEHPRTLPLIMWALYVILALAVALAILLVVVFTRSSVTPGSSTSNTHVSGKTVSVITLAHHEG